MTFIDMNTYVPTDLQKEGISEHSRKEIEHATEHYIDSDYGVFMH